MIEKGLLIQGGYNHGNHGKIRELDNSGKIMENSGNFVKLSSNQGLYFCLLNIVKKLSNRRYQKKNQGEGKEAKFNKKDWNLDKVRSK